MSGTGAANGLSARELELWRGERRLFRDVGFDLSPGELLHITGPNGAGKTSLLRVLCGLTLPETGDVHWKGRCIRRYRTEFHLDLAYTGHQVALKDDLTARENLHYHLGLSTRADEATLDAALEATGVLGQAELPARSLSAGQRRRVTLARCLASPVPLWVLDEPYTNLDVNGRALVDRLMGEHAARDGMIILVAHQDHAVEGAATRRLELA